MSKENTLNTVIELINQYHALPELSHSEKTEYRYLDNTGFDSFSLIHLISDIESEFNITLTPEDTESDQFRALGSLAELIDKKQNTNA